MDAPSRPPFRANGALTSCLAVAIVLAWLNGLLVRMVSVDVQFFGETADRGDYRVAAGAGVMTALLLVLGMVALREFGAPAWLQYVAAAGIATQLALGITAWWSSRDVDDSIVVSQSVWDGVKDVFVLPGSWFLLVVLALAGVVAVRGRSGPTPRSPQDP